MSPAPRVLLRATLSRDLKALSADTGVSSPRLAQMAVMLLDDPTVWAAHPVECRRLAQHLEQSRSARSARNLSVRIAG